VTYDVEVRLPALGGNPRGSSVVVQVYENSAGEAAEVALGMLVAGDALGLDRAALRVRPAPGAPPEVYRPRFRAHVCPVTGERDGHWDLRRVYPRGGG
jgi:hypothetical protein